MDYLDEILHSLVVSDNTLRGQAEHQYELLKKSDSCILLPQALLEYIANATKQMHIRQLASVLLRRMLVEEYNGIYRRMPVESQNALRAGLLHTLSVETNASLKSSICNIVGEFAGMILEPPEWPEILTFAYTCIQSSTSLDRETGLSLFGMLSNILVESIAQSASNAGVLVSIFQACLIDQSNNGRVMLAAIRALSIILVNVPQESDYEQFFVLTSTILRGLETSISINSTINGFYSSNDVAVSIAYAESLIDIAENTDFFATPFGLVFESVMAIIESPTTIIALRHMLVELLVTICCSSPKRTRKLRGPNGEKGYFATRFIAVCVRMMVTVTDNDPSWETADSLEDSLSSREEGSEGSMDCDVGEAALDRVTQCLGLRSTFSDMTGQLQMLFSAPHWQYQYTGLRCMGNYLEVSAQIVDKHQLLQHRTEIVNIIIAYASNPHPRVRSAAFYAATQFFIMHGKTLKGDLVHRLLTLLLSSVLINSNRSPRVRRSAMLALVNLIDSVPSSLLEGQTRAILDAIVQALSEGSVLVQEVCVQAIISVTESLSADAVTPYYDSLMPILKQLLGYAQGRGLESLWGLGLECCARVGEVSGKIKFYPDALEMMSTLVQVQSQIDDNSDVRKYILKAWVRIARCLEADFLPFLPLVMEKLLGAITQDLSAGTGDIDLDNIDERSDIEMIETEDGWKAVRTAAVEEQATACQLIVLITERLQEHFYAYVEPCVRALAPLVKSPHEDVRSYALVSLGEFVRSAAKATAPDRKGVTDIAEYCLGVIIEALGKEDVLELIMTGLQALKLVLFYLCTDWSSPSVRAMGMKDPPVNTPESSIPSLNAAQMQAIIQCCKRILQDSIQRRAVLRAEAAVSGTGKDEDDMDDERMMMHESLELHYNVSELIGAVFKTHGSLFFPVYMAEMNEVISEMSHPHCLREDRQFAYYVVSDVIEFGLNDSSCGSYLATVMPGICDACTNVEEASVRQVCSYIIGIAAEKYPQAFCACISTPAPLPFIALQALSSCISRGESPGEPRGECTDNAVSAVGTVVHSLQLLGYTGLNHQQYERLWMQWLEYLPIQHDAEEGKKVHSQLVRLTEAKHESLLCGGNTIPHIVIILLQVINTEFSNKDLNTAIVRCLNSINLQYSDSTSSPNSGRMGSKQNFLNRIVSELRPELLQAVEFVLTQGSSVSNTSPLANAPIHDILLHR